MDYEMSGILCLSGVIQVKPNIVLHKNLKYFFPLALVFWSQQLTRFQGQLISSATKNLGVLQGVEVYLML